MPAADPVFDVDACVACFRLSNGELAKRPARFMMVIGLFPTAMAASKKSFLPPFLPSVTVRVLLAWPLSRSTNAESTLPGDPAAVVSEKDAVDRSPEVGTGNTTGSKRSMGGMHLRVCSSILSEKLETLRKVRELFLYSLRLLGGCPKLSKLQRWLKLGDSRGLGSAHANYG